MRKSRGSRYAPEFYRACFSGAELDVRRKDSDMEIYKNSEHLYRIVCSPDTNNLIIEVVCGGVGMYSVQVYLLPEDEEEFESKGNLNKLAKMIAKDHRSFGDRIVEGRH